MMDRQQFSARQLEKKLDQACRDSGLSDDEKVRTLTAVLVGIIVSSTVTGDYQRWKQMAKFAVYDIFDGISINTEGAMALCAELCCAATHDATLRNADAALRHRYKVALLAIGYGMSTLATVRHLRFRSTRDSDPAS
jgi:hypothetical protein